MTNPRSPFGLPRRDSNGANGAGGHDDDDDGFGGGPGGPDGPGDGDGPRDLGGNNPDEELTLSIKGVRARQGEDPGELDLEIETTRGVISAHFTPVEGKTGTAVFLGGAGGGVRGPADEMYVTLAGELALAGVSTLRLEYRHPGEFEECVMDALAGCSFLRGIGAERAVVVGHSFGGAVAVKAGELAPLIAAVCGLSSQRFGTFEVERLAKPLLLIHGSKDEVLDQEASRDIYERARDPKRLVILEGDGHGLVQHADEVRSLVTRFVLDHAGEA